MLFKNAELHNVSELVEAEDGGFEMLRVPQSAVKDCAYKDGKAKVMNFDNANVEIRFVMKDESPVRIKLKSYDGTRNIAPVFFGGIQAGYTDSVLKISDKAQWFEIKPQWHNDLYDEVTKKAGYPFNYRCVRVILAGRNEIYDIEGNIEPPTKDMLPEKTLMVYGSSIAHGKGDLLTVNTYPYMLAKKLKYDILNLGFAGCCFAEKSLADFFAEDNRWDVALFEIGSNGWNQVEELRKNVQYFIKTVAEKNPNKKIFVTSSYLNNADYFKEGIMDDARQMVVDEAEKLNLKNVFYVRGDKISSEFKGFSIDMLHPCQRGCDIISDSLVKFIKEST